MEDEPTYARLIKEKLNRARSEMFDSRAAKSLAEAIEQLQSRDFDVVLLDLVLPDSTGIETVARVREAAPHTPIVVLTGFGAQELAVQALQQGAQDYLVKGTDENLLLRSVRYAVERSRSQAALEDSQRTLESARMQLLQFEKMDAVGRLAAGIAHEVRNPLAAIQMGIDFLKGEPAPGPAESRTALGEMELSVKQAFSLIRSLLEFCIPSDLDSRPADVNGVISDTVPMFRHDLERQGIELVLDLSPDLPKVRLDKTKIQQVLLNLVINAMDAMPAGGRLRVASCARRLDEGGPSVGRRATDRFRVGQAAVQVDIEDSGPGLTPDALSKCFDPFFTTKAPGKGTGLGLSIARGIVEQHGGYLEVRNMEPRGVRASVLLVL